MLWESSQLTQRDEKTLESLWFDQTLIFIIFFKVNHFVGAMFMTILLLGLI